MSTEHSLPAAPMGLVPLAGLICRREWLLAVRSPAQGLNPLVFFVLVIAMFPLGISPAPEVLARIAGGVIWVAALLAVLLSLESLFREDRDEGVLEQLLVSPHPLPFVVLVKVLVYALLVGGPLVLMSPVLGLMLSLPPATYGTLVAALLLGMPTLFLLGSVGAALTVGLRRGGLLLVLLVLPLYVPVLVFATAAVDAAQLGMPVRGHLALLGALLALMLVVAPVAAAGALRVTSEE